MYIFGVECWNRTNNIQVSIQSLNQLIYLHIYLTIIHLWFQGNIFKCWSRRFYYNRNQWNRTNTCNSWFHRLCPLKSINENFKNVFQYVNQTWNLLVTKKSLIKYFTLTFTRPKSSKFEGSDPPLNWIRIDLFLRWSVSNCLNNFNNMPLCICFQMLCLIYL